MKAILILSAIIAGVWADFDDVWKLPEDHRDRIKYEEVTGYGLPENPGLKVRVAQGFIDMVKRNLLDYGRAYLNFEAQINPTGMMPIQWWPFKFTIAYRNWEHDPIQLDFTDFKFDLTKMKRDHEPVIFIELPLVDFWKVVFDYDWLSPLYFDDSGRVQFEFNQTSALVTLKLDTTEYGHLYPQIHDLKLDYFQTEMTLIGDDMAQVGGHIKRLYYQAWFKVLKSVTQASLNRFGKVIYNKHLPEYFRRLTNGQKHHFELNFPQLKKTGKFVLDYGMTARPLIHNDVMDLEFLFEVSDGHHTC